MGMSSRFGSIPSGKVPSLRTIGGLSVALFLPFLLTCLSLRIEVLSHVPYALALLSVGAITFWARMPAGIVASLSLASGAWRVFLQLEHGEHPVRAALRATVTFGVGCFIAAVCEGQLRSRNRLATALSELNARTEVLTEAQRASKAVAWSYDLSTTRMTWEEEGFDVFGRSLFDASTPQTSLELVYEDDRNRVSQMYQEAIAKNAPFEIEFRCLWPNGEMHWLEARGKPSATRPHTWLGITSNIDTRKRSEQALIRSEKLAAIGRLSSTIAHELNNPLAALTNLIYLALADPALSEESREYLAVAHTQIRRLSTVARHLPTQRTFAQSGPTDLHEIAMEAVDLFAARCASKGCRIRTVEKSPVKTSAPKEDITQILINLLNNSCDAVGEGMGEIVVEVFRQEEAACIRILDNGPGIPAEVLSHLFEPFFTTKTDIGTGVGLWMARELAIRCGGRLVLSDYASPFATAFHLELPLASEIA